MGLHKTRWLERKRLLVWLAVIVLILISGSAIVMANVEAVGGIGYKSHSIVTATAKTAHSTSAVTPTPVMTASPSIEATPTQLFYDNFMNNNKQWAITDVPDLLRSMENDQLVLSVTDQRILTESVPSTTSFGNFTLTASYTLVSASQNDSVGFYVRGDSNLDHDYRIDIFGNDTVMISKEYLDYNDQPQSVELAQRSKVSAIRALGQMNTLTIDVNGPTISIVINGTPIISSLYDADYSHGQIAMFVSNSRASSASVTARFSSIEIDSIPDPLPMPTPTPSVLPSSTPSSTSTEEGNG